MFPKLSALLRPPKPATVEPQAPEERSSGEEAVAATEEQLAEATTFRQPRLKTRNL